MKKVRFKAYLMLLSVAIIWGIAGPVIKLTLEAIPPSLFISYRFLLASIFALPILLPKLHYLKKNFWLLFLYAFLNSTATLGLLFLGTSKTTLLDMSLISLFGPILMILMGYFLLKDRITKREKIGIIVAFVGSFIIAIEPISRGAHADEKFLGNILIFASLVCGATSNFLTKKLLRLGHEPIFITNFSFVVGFLTSSFFVKNENYYSLLSLPLNYHLGVLYMALISGTLAYYLSAKAQKSIELSEQAVFAYIHPAISAFFAMFLLGNQPTIQHILGGVIAITGVAIAEIKRKRYNNLL